MHPEKTREIRYAKRGCTLGDYIAHHNANPKGFVWVAKAEDILEKVRRARKTLDKLPSA